MTWLTENPWPLIIILGSGAVFLTSRWMQYRDAKLLLTAVLLLACMGGVFVIDRLVVTPREKVQIAVRGIVEAFQRGNVEQCQSFVSGQAMLLKLLIHGAADVFAVENDLRLSDINIDLVARNSRAIAIFRVNATVELKGTDYKEYQPTRWETTWQQEEGEWKLVKLKELDPITGQELHRLDQVLGRLRGRS